jgi:trehalose-phosphatase
MQILRESLDLDGFFGRVRASDAPVLMLDYDGTLAPFRVNRDEAVPYPGVVGRLERLVREAGTRLIIVTGRSIAVLKRLIDLPKGVEVWGGHGAERLLPHGTLEVVELDPEVIELFETARQWAEENGLGRQVETKPTGLALHWRGLPSSTAVLRSGCRGLIRVGRSSQ